MKITHLCLGAFYVDNHSYQENVIPKYHKKMGHDVSIIASTLSFDMNGNATHVEARKYLNENNIRVNRLNYNPLYPKSVAKFLRLYSGTYKAIEETQPDIIFIHGCQFLDITEIVRYIKKNPKVIVYIDNHADFSNSATNWLSKNILHKVLWRSMAKMMEPYTKMYYGVLPARVDFLTDIYKIPKEKVELLPLGVDDDEVNKLKIDFDREQYRKKYNVTSKEFLIVSGGKIDNSKKQILLLMAAIKKINSSKIKLIVFGSIIPELKEDIDNLIDNDRIIFVGWLNNEEIYKLLASSELAVYPGRHSVLWEQTVGIGIPMIVKYWPGTTHIDVGGNVEFIYEDSVENIIQILDWIFLDSNYQNMKEVAENKGIREFSYEKISEKSIT